MDGDLEVIITINTCQTCLHKVFALRPLKILQVQVLIFAFLLTFYYSLHCFIVIHIKAIFFPCVAYTFICLCSYHSLYSCFLFLKFSCDRNLISDYCEQFFMRMAQYSLRSQILAYHYSMLTLLDQFPSIRYFVYFIYILWACRTIICINIV